MPYPRREAGPGILDAQGLVAGGRGQGAGSRGNEIVNLAVEKTVYVL